MGSGRGGLHHGTWGSHEGEELRARVGAAFKQFGGSLAGDAAAELAEALVRIASGESPEDVVPEPGEVAFDLALDALSPFVPGGRRVTRELGEAAKHSNPSKGYLDALEKGLVSERNLEQNAEYANEIFRMTEGGYFGERGAKKGVRRIYPSDPAADSLELYERLGRGAEDQFVEGVDGMTRRWLSDETAIIHRSSTSTPDSPSVEIARPGTDKVKKQRIHFFEEKTW